ncbi:aminoacyl-tRNA hydrolase [Alkalispirochaeta americana]|uniref:aminoacyl-tRNA hydrolase n=1 Tax=Alkalispirochaeta americana TaxID=159291 RepID=UPI0013563EB2|nr:aminoacyl-tRNA hydrolase [Alkalispirochaeta americana]
MAAPLILVGLGNPGPDYDQTRHNVGFDFVDRLADSMGLPWRRPWFRPFHIARSSAVVLVKPRTYMNRSGRVFPYLLSRFQVSPAQVCVVVDNMDLPVGEVRMKRKGSPAGHNGLKSIHAVLGSDDYPRLYVGIGRPGAGADTVEHVLGSFNPQERLRVEAAFERILPLFTGTEGLSLDQQISAVNDLRRPPPEDEALLQGLPR